MKLDGFFNSEKCNYLPQFCCVNVTQRQFCISVISQWLQQVHIFLSAQERGFSSFLAEGVA